MITHTPPLAGYLLIKTFVARQQPTNTDVHIHLYTHYFSCKTRVKWLLYIKLYTMYMYLHGELLVYTKSLVVMYMYIYYYVAIVIVVAHANGKFSAHVLA